MQQCLIDLGCDPNKKNDLGLSFNLITKNTIEEWYEMTKGKSSVYISHRLASTRFCDHIILIEGSAILEEGTHQQLMEKEGRYAELFAVQSKYYEKGEEGNEG